MWHAIYRHECGDRTVRQIEQAQVRHPIDAVDLTPRCIICGDLYRLVAWTGPQQQPERPKRWAAKRKRFNAQQRTLF